MFEVLRERLGFKLGVVPLLAMIVLNVLTLSAEIAGLPFVLQLVVDVSYLWLLIPIALGVLMFQWFRNWTRTDKHLDRLGAVPGTTPARRYVSRQYARAGRGRLTPRPTTHQLDSHWCHRPHPGNADTWPGITWVGWALRDLWLRLVLGRDSSQRLISRLERLYASRHPDQIEHLSGPPGCRCHQ